MRPANCPENVWAAASKAERDFIVAHEVMHALVAEQYLQAYLLLLPEPTTASMTVAQAQAMHDAIDHRINAMLGESRLSRVRPVRDGLRTKYRHANVKGRPRQ